MLSQLKDILVPSKNKYLVIHIPKTAGTSLNSMLAKVFGEDAISPPFDARAFGQMNAHALKKYTIVQGHIGWQDAERHFPDCQTLTFLREPLDRCLSWYFYLKQQELKGVVPLESISNNNSPEEAISLAKQLDIDEFFNSDHPHILQNICNRQTYQLGDEITMEKRDLDAKAVLARAIVNVEKIGFVGFFSRFNSDMENLACWLGCAEPLEIVYANETLSRFQVSDLSSSARNKLEQLNEFDLELYQRAMSMR